MCALDLMLGRSIDRTYLKTPPTVRSAEEREFESTKCFLGVRKVWRTQRRRTDACFKTQPLYHNPDDGEGVGLRNVSLLVIPDATVSLRRILLNSAAAKASFGR